MKRKIATGLGLTLAAVLLSSQAFADTWINNGTTSAWGASEDGKTEVTYTVPSTYTVVIPASITIGANGAAGGVEDNVFIKTSSQIADTEKITVSLKASQNLVATRTGSSMPFTVSYRTQDGTTSAGSLANVTGTLSAAIPILEETGLQIGLVANTPETTTGAADLSATVQASATADQLAAASVAGVHTGTIQFEVELT